MHKNTLYLTLGLLLSATLSTVANSYQAEQEHHQDFLMQEKDKIKAELDACNQELYELFEKFFDHKDTTPFSKIVGKVITILKTKRAGYTPEQQIKCDNVIKLFEKNRFITYFPTWAKIFTSPDLMELMTPETRAYIHSLSMQVKIQALIKKLQH